MTHRSMYKTLLELQEAHVKIVGPEKSGISTITNLVTKAAAAHEGASVLFIYDHFQSMEWFMQEFRAELAARKIDVLHLRSDSISLGYRPLHEYQTVVLAVEALELGQNRYLLALEPTLAVWHVINHYKTSDRTPFMYITARPSAD